MSRDSIPGVYFRIDEIGVISAVATAVPAFIGHTNLASKNGESVRGIPTRINSMLEYELLFGFANPEAITVKIEDIYSIQNGQPATLSLRNISAMAPRTPSPFKMYYSLRLFFDNGGGPCYIVSVNDFNSLPSVSDEPNSLLSGLAALEKFDEPTLIVIPDDLTIGNAKTVYTEALAQCEKLQDRFVILDVKEKNTNPIKDAFKFRSYGIDTRNLKYGAAYYPNLKSTLNYGYDSDSVTITQTNTILGTGSPNPPIVNAAEGKKLIELSTEDPILHQAILVEINKLFVTVPPSGAIAGVYARVDSYRGVWKAPANVAIYSVIGPALRVSDEQQALLNVDAISGKSINAIRSFKGKGTLVWGVRTLAGNDNEWRYVHIRRLIIFIEESVKISTAFVVFEPNDANTWQRIKTMIEIFLIWLWRNGALAGAKPQLAFFVRIGLGSTMTAQDILEGRMIVEIGLAVARPAEFFLLRLSLS